MKARSKGDTEMNARDTIKARARAKETLRIAGLEIAGNEVYRVVVGEVGNEQGHICSPMTGDEMKARRQLALELSKYKGDGWGRVEVCRENGTWEALDLWAAALTPIMGKDEGE